MGARAGWDMSTTPHAREVASTPTIASPSQVRLGDLTWAVLSRRGSRGGANEDAVLARPPNFFGVADGVGSGSHGEVASQVALRHCAGARNLSPQALVRHVQSADAAVAAALAPLSDLPGAATLVALWLVGRSARLLHVGDARALLFRRGWSGRWCLAWRTQDQTYAALGRTPPLGGNPDNPCCMVGAGAVGEPGLKQFRLQDEDVILLCSDGLHHHVSETALTGIVSGGLRSGLDLDEVARQMVTQAARNGSPDDITVLLLRTAGARAQLWLALLLLLVAGWTVWAVIDATGIF